MIIKHGISVGINRIDDKFYLYFKVVGKLTHQDYEYMIPMIEQALKSVEDPKLHTLVDMTEFEGMELRAVWDDLKFALKNDSEFQKIAIIGNKPWEEIMSKIADWFLGGECKYFEDHDKAVEWLQR